MMKNWGEEGKEGSKSEGFKMSDAFKEKENQPSDFERLYTITIDKVMESWDCFRQNQQLKIQDLKNHVQAIADFLNKGQEGVRFFNSRESIPYYYLNVANVVWFSVLVGIELKFPSDKLIELGLTGILHDIGLSRIDSTILDKKEKLTFDEYELIRQHPEEGKKLLSQYKDLSINVINGVYQEHERENGSGYPEGLRGKQIHEFAKIVGLADVFEAMTHFRDYREPVSPNEAVMEILSMKGKLFDEKYIKALINIFTFYPMGSYVQLNTNEIGRVIRVSKSYPTRPEIEVLIDKEGVQVGKPYNVKLTEKNLIYVKEALTEEKVRYVLEGNSL